MVTELPEVLCGPIRGLRASFSFLIGENVGAANDPLDLKGQQPEHQAYDLDDQHDVILRTTHRDEVV